VKKRRKTIRSLDEDLHEASVTNSWVENLLEAAQE